ncbi:MAG: hypothetical protein ABUT20_02405 [Bacteroidota bacterium]
MNRKLILIATVIFCRVLIIHAQEKHSSVSISSNDSHTSMTIKDDKLKFTFSYTSTEDISFTDDEKGFRSFPDDGVLRYEKDGKKLVVRKDASGNIVYAINGGENKTTLTDNEKDIVAGAIRVMIEYGVGAKDRVARLYKNGGTKAVLDEVKNMKTDYVRAVYLQFLLSTNNLSATDMTEIANNTQSLISSDYEKGKLLEAFSSKYLGNAATAKAFLEAVKSIHSDYEKAKAVKGILHQELTDEQFTNVIDITNTINSDYEKAGVLKEVIVNNKISASRFTELLHATAKISSDYEKAGVLKKVFETGVRVPENAFAETLDAAATINSDYEKAGVLKKLADSEIKSDENWTSLIKATARLGGDYEKGETLRFVATKMPASDTVKDAFMKSAKTISSDYEFGKTIKALK